MVEIDNSLSQFEVRSHLVLVSQVIYSLNQYLHCKDIFFLIKSTCFLVGTVLTKMQSQNHDFKVI